MWPARAWRSRAEILYLDSSLVSADLQRADLVQLSLYSRSGGLYTAGDDGDGTSDGLRNIEYP